MAKSKVSALTCARKPPLKQPTLSGFVKSCTTVYEFHAAWQLAIAQQDFDAHTLKQLKVTEADRAEDAALWGMIRTPSEHMVEIAQKLEVFRHYNDGAKWADQRNTFLLASITADVERGEFGMKKLREHREAAQS